MQTAQLTIELPDDQVRFLERYAQEHDTSLAQLVTGYVRQLQGTPSPALHPDIIAITGLIRPDTEVKTEYRNYVADRQG